MRAATWILAGTTVALAGGCFNPSYPENLPCDVNGWCPPGQICNGESLCVAGSADAGVPGDGLGADALLYDAGDLGRLLSISIGEDVILAIGGTHQFVVIGTYELGNAEITDWSIWRSSNTAAASVDINGLCTAHALGDAVISADYDGRVDEAVVSVQ